MAKTLIAYFSRPGGNYLDGRIVDLPVGNTQTVALKLRERTGAELFRIETVKEYPSDYDLCTRIARQELNADARPELTGKVSDMAQYDTVILGYPNWWGTMPMAVYTFLESYDFTGKTVVPFCTHEGSGMGRSEQEIERLCAGARVVGGVPVRGSKANRADKEIERLARLAGME